MGDWSLKYYTFTIFHCVSQESEMRDECSERWFNAPIGHFAILLSNGHWRNIHEDNRYAGFRINFVQTVLKW